MNTYKLKRIKYYIINYNYPERNISANIVKKNSDDYYEINYYKIYFKKFLKIKL